MLKFWNLGICLCLANCSTSNTPSTTAQALQAQSVMSSLQQALKDPAFQQQFAVLKSGSLTDLSNGFGASKAAQTLLQSASVQGPLNSIAKTYGSLANFIASEKIDEATPPTLQEVLSIVDLGQALQRGGVSAVATLPLANSDSASLARLVYVSALAAAASAHVHGNASASGPLALAGPGTPQVSVSYDSDPDHSYNEISYLSTLIRYYYDGSAGVSCDSGKTWSYATASGAHYTSCKTSDGTSGAYATVGSKGQTGAFSDEYGDWIQSSQAPATPSNPTPPPKVIINSKSGSQSSAVQ